MAFIRNPSDSLGLPPPSAESEQTTERRGEAETERDGEPTNAARRKEEGAKGEEEGKEKEQNRGGRVRKLR